ncbi:MAG: hypothetical protein ACREVZ_16240 [Burkholderiales bacterium]
MGTKIIDAEFRFCRLGEVDFGDAEQMSVFGGLADFRGCTMRSLRLDYVDGRGDVMLLNLQVAPGDLTLRHAALRGARTDFSGLQVAGRLDLEGAYISALHFRWPELAGALRRAAPRSDVLRPLQGRLDALQQDDEAREASAMLAEQVLRERLERPDTAVTERAGLWLERIVWGWTTGYGTRLGRIAALTLTAWLLLSAPLWLWPGLPLGRWKGAAEDAPPRHRAVAADALQAAPMAALDRRLQQLGYSFGLMFSTPRLMLRPAQPLRRGVESYLAALRGIGAVLLALLGLTLANVSPVFKAILGKVVG